MRTMFRLAAGVAPAALGTAFGLALCAAIGTLGASPAAAIVRPKKEAEPKAQTCPEVGEGYVRVAGSDTCVRVGGSVRVEGAAISR